MTVRAAIGLENASTDANTACVFINLSVAVVARSLIHESSEDEVLEQRVFSGTGEPLRDFEILKQRRVRAKALDLGSVVHAPDVEQRDVIAVPRARLSRGWRCTGAANGW